MTKVFVPSTKLILLYVEFVPPLKRKDVPWPLCVIEILSCPVEFATDATNSIDEVYTVVPFFAGLVNVIKGNKHGMLFTVIVCVAVPHGLVTVMVKVFTAGAKVKGAENAPVAALKV